MRVVVDNPASKRSPTPTGRTCDGKCDSEMRLGLQLGLRLRAVPLRSKTRLFVRVTPGSESTRA